MHCFIFSKARFRPRPLRSPKDFCESFRNPRPPLALALPSLRSFAANSRTLSPTNNGNVVSQNEIRSKLDDLFVRESGDRACREALVLLHGSPLSSRSWAPQLSAFADEFHVLAPDLPRHGNSSHISADSITDVVDAVASTIRSRTQKARAHVVGLSYGGVIAQHLAATHPDLVDKLVLSGTSTPLSRWLVEISLRADKPVLNWLGPKRAAKLLSWQFGMNEDLVREDLEAAHPEATDCIRFYQDFQTPSTRNSSTLVLVGSKETYLARKSARDLSKKIRNAEGYVVKGVGHVWNLERPDLFNEVLRDFLKGQSFSFEVRSKLTLIE